ncbi:MAG: alpha/beta fold hydrolase [Bacteroidota bacterium]|jgi:3-oxoadipate enol-lactonase
MKSGLILTAILFISMSNPAQTTFIQTNIGKIAIHNKESTSDNLPIILLHGVYFDHHLWDEQVKHIDDRTVIMIDMPLHGESREITKSGWSLNDCAEMLIEILNSLQIPKVIAVGHSWGSMTILRAADKQPKRFESIGLCNMPLHAASKKQKWIMGLQHSLLLYREFYTKQAAKALFGKTSLVKNPSLINQLSRPMSALANKEIKLIDKKVILDAEDGTSLIQNLQVKAIALKGKEDYVPIPPKIETIIVEGGHISPLEQPIDVSKMIKKLMLQIDYKSLK